MTQTAPLLLRCSDFHREELLDHLCNHPDLSEHGRRWADRLRSSFWRDNGLSERQVEILVDLGMKAGVEVAPARWRKGGGGNG